MLGLGFGFAGAAWRDFADRVFRTAYQVESTLQAECIALLPAIGKSGQVKAVKPVKARRDRSVPFHCNNGNLFDRGRRAVIGLCGSNPRH